MLKQFKLNILKQILCVIKGNKWYSFDYIKNLYVGMCLIIYKLIRFKLGMMMDTVDVGTSLSDFDLH